MSNQSITVILLMLAAIGIFLSFSPFLYDADVSATASIVNHTSTAMTVGSTEQNVFWFIQVIFNNIISKSESGVNMY